MDDLGNAVVVVVIFCDIVSSLLHFFFGISHSTADMGGPDHGNIIFGISGSNGITQWDSGVFTEKTNGRALVNTGSDVLQVFIAGEETVDLGRLQSQRSFQDNHGDAPCFHNLQPAL